MMRRAPIRGEAPGPADQDPHADPLAVEIADLLDLAVLRGDHLRAAQDHARVRIVGAGAERRIDSRFAQSPHARETLATRVAAPWAAATMALPQALVAELVDALG